MKLFTGFFRGCENSKPGRATSLSVFVSEVAESSEERGWKSDMSMNFQCIMSSCTFFGIEPSPSPSQTLDALDGEFRLSWAVISDIRVFVCCATRADDDSGDSLGSAITASLTFENSRTLSRASFSETTPSDTAA